jgi:parallel beta-helix repeat protein
MNGVDLIDSDYSKIYSNRLENNGKDLFILRSGNGNVEGNLLSEGYIGVQLDSSWENNLTGNIISENHYGLEISDSVRNIVMVNNITNNTIGVLYDKLGNNTINNTMTNNSNNTQYIEKLTAGVPIRIVVPISSYPKGATVLINGIPRDDPTPMNAVFTSSGSYDLELRLNDKSKTQKIIISKDTEPQPVNIDLDTK